MTEDVTESADQSETKNDLPIPDLKPWFRTVEDLGGKVSWPEIFGNDNPVELDIGCGRGLFLFTAAEANPETNYMGFEIDFREGRRTAKRLQKREMANARVIGGDCRLVLSKVIETGSVDAAHVYFPDPWWKKRHRRRRIFTDEFAGWLHRIVKPNGHVHSWTDVGDYFEVISSLMEHHKGFETLPAPAERDPEHDMDYQTSFERKKRQAGCNIWRGLWRRVETPNN